jgi:hypothetical protein
VTSEVLLLATGGRARAHIAITMSACCISFLSRISLGKRTRQHGAESGLRRSNVTTGQGLLCPLRMSALGQKQTCALHTSMSAKCQKRTSVQPKTNTATRGGITLISVNSPGCVSTSIEPPCCQARAGRARCRRQAVGAARPRAFAATTQCRTSRG